MTDKTVCKGSLLSMFSAMLWGVSGAVGQFLFSHRGFEPQWLVTIRMLLSGIIILGYLYIKDRNKIFLVWRNKTDIIDMLLFSIVGMLATQYTYFVAIGHSNAATATVLQYLAPVIIMLYISLRGRKLPNIMEILAVICALVGTFLLATHGKIDSLSISGAALFWGLASAFALAFYSIQPKRLLDSFDSMTLIGWAMLVGGLFISFINPPWKTAGVWDTASISFVTFIVILGTLIPYSCYLFGIKMIGATKASLFASVEPLSSAIVSIIWLKVSLAFIDIIGFIFIIATVFLLSIKLPHHSVKNQPSESVHNDV